MNGSLKSTTYKVVLPFYIYAAISFLTGTILLFFFTPAFAEHYFHPHTLAITHIMALGWGTMIILGAGHQLIPVLAETKLFSTKLAALCFVLAATGIPLLAYGFFVFDMGWPAQCGGILINGAVFVFLLNTILSVSKNKKENIHALFIVTAACWLLITTGLGLLLVFNFIHPVLSKDSLSYLPLHAHLGIVGWFLLLITGVGARLIPMFLFSKYENNKLLWLVYFLINAGLLLFCGSFIYFEQTGLYLLPALLIFAGVVSFARYIRQAYKTRIKKRVDSQVKTALLSVALTILPVIILAVFITLPLSDNKRIVMVYGFTIFFGWITVIILGMTFKTLPFIVWNRLYGMHTGIKKIPDPKDLFSRKLFVWMCATYFPGFILFALAIFLSNDILLKVAAFLMIAAAVFYNSNVIKTISHRKIVS